MNELDPVTRGYITMRPEAAAQTLVRLDDHGIRAIFEAMPRQLAARVLEHMAPGSASHCLQQLSNKTIAEIVTHMPVLSTVAPLRLMKREQLNELYKLMPQAAATHLRLRLRYADTVIGAYIDSDVVVFSPEHRVSDALRLFRREGHRTGHTIHVLDEQRHVAGTVLLSDLVSTRDRSLIKNIMRPAVELLRARAALQTVSNHPAWLTHESLPVVNRNGVFQGVLRRTKVMGRERRLLSDVAEQHEAETTRAALADIFWMAVGALFIGRSASSTASEVEES